MATQTLTTADAILKNVYRGVIVEQLNQETYIIDKVEKTNANDLGTFDGRQLVIAVHSGRNRGRGVTGDGGTLPSAGTQSYLNAFVKINYFAGSIELTDLVVKQTQTDEGAFVKALTSEMDLAIQDMRKDACRMAYGTGDGLLATVSGTPGAGTSITVDSGQYISVGDQIDILVKSSGATTNGVVGANVTAVSFGGTADSSTQANATLTIDSATAGSTDNTYGVYLHGDRNSETAGLRNITNTGRSLHSIDSSTYPIWDGNVLDASNTAPNEDLFMRLAQQIRQRSGKNVGTFITTLGVQRRLALQYTSQKRVNDAKAVDVPGGYASITVSAGGKPVDVIADVDAVNGYAFALPQEETFSWAQLHAADWLQAPTGNGQVLTLKDGSTAGSKVATWQGFIAWPAGLACIAPNRTGQLKNLNDDKPVLRV